jgi:anti-sigma B factor antagonist
VDSLLFEITVVRHPRCDVLNVTGEVDLSNSAKLQHAVEAEGPESRQSVVVNLTELYFIDSSGLNALVKGQKTLSERGIGMWVVVPEGGDLRTVFEITNLVGTLNVVGSLPEGVTSTA